MAPTVRARIYRDIGSKRLEMAIEDINPREQATALATVRLMLLFLGVIEQICLCRRHLAALNTVIWSIFLDATVALSVGCQNV